MSDKMAFMVIMALGVTLEVIGDVLFKYWAEGKRWALLAGLAFYLAGSLGWAYSLKYEDLGKAVIVFTLVNAIAVVAAGQFLFGEKMSTANWLGVALAIVAIILCESD